MTIDAVLNALYILGAIFALAVIYFGLTSRQCRFTPPPKRRYRSALRVLRAIIFGL